MNEKEADAMRGVFRIVWKMSDTVCSCPYQSEIDKNPEKYTGDYECDNCKAINKAFHVLKDNGGI